MTRPVVLEWACLGLTLKAQWVLLPLRLFVMGAYAKALLVPRLFCISVKDRTAPLLGTPLLALA